MSLRKIDQQVWQLIQKEKRRQAEGLELIPSENYVSPAVREALGSVLTNKYAEGYPGKRYYGGNEIVDQMESLAVERAKKLFKVPHANVQPYSGSPANQAVHGAICQLGDPILSQQLTHGGHLSMGQTASLSSRFYRAHHYGLTKKGGVDFSQLEKTAREVRPKIIWCGGTAYTLKFDFARYAEIADQVGAYFVADIAHIAGLVAAGVHPSPVYHVHVVTTTTHKTLRGPRGGMIMVTRKGLKKDPDLATKIDRAVFPGLQGGPHENQIAALAVALKEASLTGFKAYSRQVVKNAKVLARTLKKAGFDLVGDGTQNHLVWVDLTKLGVDGWQAQHALDAAGMTVNRQTIPFDPRPPYYPSGVRLGTPAMTTRGMKEKETRKIGEWIIQVAKIAQEMDFEDIGHADREKDQAARKKFKVTVKTHHELKEIRRQVGVICRQFPIL